MSTSIYLQKGITTFHTKLALLLACGLILTCIYPAQADGVVPGHVLTRLNTDTDVNEVESDYGTAIEDHLANTGLYSLKTPAGSTETEFAAQLNKDSRVAWAETDTYLDTPEVQGAPFHFAFEAGPKPGAYVNQAAYQQVNLGNTIIWGATGAGVVVAILDTGATYSHPALKGHLLPGYNALHPGSPPNDIKDGSNNAAVGHGTMIAGIIARLAPGAKILPVRVLNADGIGTLIDVAKGIDYAVSHGAQVLNMSFGTTQRSQALEEAMGEAQDAGVCIVASAGNEDKNTRCYPAANDGVLAVASVEVNDTKSPYSNYGDFISLVAPGTGIRSTYYTGGYANWSGTSFAAPFITAEAVLLLSRSRTLTSDVIEATISQTAHSVDHANPPYEEELGDGIIDIETAVKSVP